MAVFLIILGVFGLCVGSFLNVLAYRIPKKLPIALDRSKCSHCDAVIKSYDLIPVFSWLILRGRCRNCHEKIHWRYPLVELITCVAFVTVGAQFGINWETPAFLVFVSGLIAISSVDFELYIIPNRIVYPTGFACLALLTLAAAMTHDWHSYRNALLGSVGAWLFMFIVHLISPRGMGFGDVRLAALIGLMLGWIDPLRIVTGLFFGFAIGAFVGIALMALRIATRKTAIPFGPFLAVGAYLALFFDLKIGPQ
jgi:leader peptidase (prepilin peptidase)/N-methyltransferase